MSAPGRIDEAAASSAFQGALGDYEQTFETFFLARLLGLEFAYEGEACTVRLDVKDFMFNPQGSLHGGVVCLILDISMGHLLRRTSGTGVTLEMKTQFLRPVGVGVASCRAVFNKRGRSVNSLESRLSDNEGRLCALGPATWLLK